MIILPFDTETNGTPIWDRQSSDPRQPRVVQLCAELVDEETREVRESMNFIIKPEGWTIPEDMTAIHGISMERAMDEGKPMADVLAQFIHMWKKCDQRVAHNQSFDARMIRIELVRDPVYKIAHWNGTPFADYWKDGKSFCTQANSTKLVNTTRVGKKKTASLAEAYQFFTGKPLEGAHDAAVDLMACKTVYFGLKDHVAKTA